MDEKTRLLFLTLSVYLLLSSDAGRLMDEWRKTDNAGKFIGAMIRYLVMIAALVFSL
jgi:hypothetical protein